MKELLAKGKIDSKTVEVLCESENGVFEFLFNGEPNKNLEARLREMLKQRQRIGNYSAKTDKLKLCAIFDRRGFFDMPADEVEVYGSIEQIPYKDGVVF